jgi:hypothetical protein
MQDRSRMEQRRRALGPAFVVVDGFAVNCGCVAVDDFVVHWHWVAGRPNAGV